MTTDTDKTEKQQDFENFKKVIKESLREEESDMFLEIREAVIKYFHQKGQTNTEMQLFAREKEADGTYKVTSCNLLAIEEFEDLMKKGEKEKASIILREFVKSLKNNPVEPIAFMHVSEVFMNIMKKTSEETPDTDEQLKKIVEEGLKDAPGTQDGLLFSLHTERFSFAETYVQNIDEDGNKTCTGGPEMVIFIDKEDKNSDFDDCYSRFDPFI